MEECQFEEVKDKAKNEAEMKRCNLQSRPFFGDHSKLPQLFGRKISIGLANLSLIGISF